MDENPYAPPSPLDAKRVRPRQTSYGAFLLLLFGLLAVGILLVKLVGAAEWNGAL